MKKGIVVLAASYPSRIFKKGATPKSPDILALCSGGYIMIAAESKIKELPLLYFFSTDNRSKVIFRVTQKSLRILLDYFRKYLALAGGPASPFLLTVVALQAKPLDNPSHFAPTGRMVEELSRKPPLRLARLFDNSRNDISNLKCKCYCYGK